MSDFIARIKAILDTSNIEKQLQELQNKDIKINFDPDDAQQSVKRLDQEVRTADRTTRSFANTLRGAVVAAKTFDVIRDSAKKAVGIVKELDGAITNLRMATGDSYRSVSKLVQDYNSLGKSLGATTTEITDSANLWLRQGHSIEETNTLIRDSLILSKVAALDSADSTAYLTSSVMAFNVEARDAIGIVDKLTAIDLVSATDAGGLAEAMSRTAKTAQLAGLSMDKLLGYLAVTGEVTQRSMSSIGESFESILTRIGSIKAGKLQLIDEDGTVEILSDVELVLSNLGIKLRDSNSEFRNFGLVLDEVAAHWESYSSVQKAAISKAFAGTYHAENFRVLMDNYEQATKYMNIAANSAGTAEKKFGAYLDSIEAKTKSLQAAFEALAFDSISTETIGGIVEATTAVIEFVDKTNILKGALAGGTLVGGVKVFIAKDPYNKDLIARREELLALQQDSIIAAEAEKQAIIDMVEEGINLELSSLKELIDAYTESLDSARDLHDYQKKVQKQTAEVASLQKQLAAYQNDTSEENRARLQKLEVDLSDAMEDLEETQYDRYIKEQKRLLDDFYDDYEENLNQRLDDVDALISDMIDTVNANSGDIANTIRSECADVGYTLSSSMNSIWTSGGAANDVISAYGNAFTEQLTTLNAVISGIASNVASMAASGDQIANETVNSTTTVTEPVDTNPPSSEITAPTTPPPITESTTPPPTASTTPTTPEESAEEKKEEKKKKVKITSGTWHIRAGAGKGYDVVGYAKEGDTFDYLGKSGSWNAVSYKGNKRWIYNQGSKVIDGYSRGGYIAELQKIAMRNGDDIVTVNTLKRGEAVLTPEQTAILRQFAENNLTVRHDVLDTSKLMSQIVGKPISASNSEHYGAKYEVENNITVEIDHVDNYDDLVYRMQKDHKFEKMIQAMTVDQLVGGSKLAKHKIRV